MKTIFRYANLSLLLAALLALGVVGGMAQNPCEDAEGLTKLGDSVREKFPVKTIAGRRAFLDAGKQFLEKYAACEPGKELGEWLKVQVPKNEKILAQQIIDEDKARLAGQFDGALKAKNWEVVYSSGKEILSKYADDFRAAELVLGSIGYDEMLDRQNHKYNDETMRFAKQALADLEAGKEFKPGFGVAPFVYQDRNDSIAWMNLTIGSIYQIGQKNKTAALPYLYRATQATGSAVSKNPNPYEFIGSYYFDELNKLVDKIKTAAASQNEADPPEVAEKKVEDIKALVALSNGTAERAMDAFSRAYSLADPKKAAEYRAKMKQNVADAYKLRFAKDEGVDAWIASAVAKPFVNPQTPVQPISDPEPVKTDATSSTPASSPATTVKPAAPAPIKPTPDAKPTPGSKPAVNTKSVSVAKKSVARK